MRRGAEKVMTDGLEMLIKDKVRKSKGINECEIDLKETERFTYKG